MNDNDKVQFFRTLTPSPDWQAEYLNVESSTGGSPYNGSDVRKRQQIARLERKRPEKLRVRVIDKKVLLVLSVILAMIVIYSKSSQQGIKAPMEAIVERCARGAGVDPYSRGMVTAEVWSSYRDCTSRGIGIRSTRKPHRWDYAIGGGV